MTYAEANAFQKAMRRFASSGPGAKLFARIAHHIDRPVYGLTGGRRTFTALIAGLPVVMLTTIGARSGERRSVPVVGIPTDDGLAVIASNFGQRRQPGWYYNLRAHPEGEFEVEGVSRPFRAFEADGAVRSRIWEQGVKIYPGWTEYERRAAHRRIAIFVLVAA